VNPMPAKTGEETPELKMERATLVTNVLRWLNRTKNRTGGNFYTKFGVLKIWSSNQGSHWEWEFVDNIRTLPSELLSDKTRNEIRFLPVLDDRFRLGLNLASIEMSELCGNVVIHIKDFDGNTLLHVECESGDFAITTVQEWVEDYCEGVLYEVRRMQWPVKQ